MPLLRRKVDGEDMDFRIVSLSEGFREKLFPKHILRLFTEKGFETLVTACFENNKPVSIALFSRMYPVGEVYLDYICTIPGLRRKGIASSLIGFSSDVLSTLGFQRLLVKKYLEPGDALNYQDLLRSLGFSPLYLGGRLLIYRLEDTEMAEVRPVILRNIEKLPHISDFREVGEKRFRSFMNETGRSDVTGMAGYIPCSFFYMAEDQVNGAMLSIRSAPGTIHIPITHMDSRAVKDNVFLVLLTDVLTAAEKNLGHDFSFIINVDKELIFKGLTQVFNPPDHQYFLMEHILPLKGEGISEKGRFFPEGELTVSEEELMVSGGNAETDGEGFVFPNVTESLTLRENHLLSEQGYSGLEDQKLRGLMEDKLKETFARYSEEEKRFDSAKRAKEHLLNFWELKEKLSGDPSLKEEEVKEKLRSYAGSITDDVRLYRELYVDKLGSGKRKERILEYLDRYDRVLGNG